MNCMNCMDELYQGMNEWIASRHQWHSDFSPNLKFQRMVDSRHPTSLSYYMLAILHACHTTSLPPRGKRVDIVLGICFLLHVVHSCTPQLTHDFFGVIVLEKSHVMSLLSGFRFQNYNKPILKVCLIPRVLFFIPNVTWMSVRGVCYYALMLVSTHFSTSAYYGFRQKSSLACAPRLPCSHANHNTFKTILAKEKRWACKLSMKSTA